MIAALLAALALTVQADPGAAPGPDARSVPIETAFPFWTDYLALPEDERSAFVLEYVIRVRSGAEARFWIETAEGYERLDQDESGAVPAPPAEAFAAQRRLFTDAPEGGASVSMRLSLPGPAAQVYTLRELEAGLAQAHNAMRGLMGIRALFMPRLDTVRFSFDGPAPDAQIVFEDGRSEPVQTVYGDLITVRPRDRALRGAVEVRFGAAPVMAVLETER